MPGAQADWHFTMTALTDAVTGNRQRSARRHTKK